ncbi:MAG: hypothetical protein H8D65_01335 [Spirochaetes bacterium]|nr:hypothetical protein [Spirochaetota bacterium]
MNIIDRIFLLLTGLVAIFTIYTLITGNQSKKTVIYPIISLSVLTISGVLLIIFGWEILGLMGDGISNKLVAVVASLIPFAWAIGVVNHINKKLGKIYLPIMILGVLLITISRFSNSSEFARIIYPVFHGLAGLTIVFLPLLTFKRAGLKLSYLLVSLGGLLISTGGMALSFIMADRQLLFFSADFVLMILAPLLFLTALAYGAGLIFGVKSE